MTPAIGIAGEGDLASWQAFVDSRADAGPLHHAGWYDVLREAYRVRPHFLVARDEAARIVGVMPGYRSRSRFTGSHYTTLEGGVLAASDLIARALTESAKDLRNEPGMTYVQIRGGWFDETAPVKLATVHTLVPTSHGADAALAAIKTKTRWGIRQAEKQDLVVTLDTTRRGLEDFYAVYAAHMRELGTPVFGVRTFLAMGRYLGPDRLRLYLLRYRGNLVGGMLCVVHGCRWTDLYAVVRRAEATEFANYFLYWSVIRDAAERGVTEIDLGRSTPGSNVHLFKRKWGGVDVDVPYLFYPAPGASPGKTGLLSEKREKGLPQKVWSSLPLPITNVVGPIIRRDLPFL